MTPYDLRTQDRIRRNSAPDEGGCWIWQRARTKGGYGLSNYRMQQTSTDPGTLSLDHLCRVPLCVNPNHLEAVTMQENLRRSDSPASVNARKTHCNWGHEFNDENTYVWHGKRSCRPCGARVAREARAA